MSWLTSTELFSPELYFLSRLPAEMDVRRDHRRGGDGAGAVAAGDALSVVARGAARSGRGAALRVSAPNRPRTDDRLPVALPARTVERAAIRQGESDARNPQRRRARASGRGSRWRWSRRRAPANRRCCISPACWSIPTAARSISTATPTSTLSDAERTRIRRTEIGFVYQVAPPAAGVLRARERDAAADDPRPVARGGAARAPTELLSYLGLKERADAPAGGTVRRRAAARRDRARGRQCAAHPAGRRADRQSRPAHRRPCVPRADAAGAGVRPGDDLRHPQHGTRRPHGPPRDAAGRRGGGAGLGTAERKNARQRIPPARIKLSATARSQ